MKFSKREWVFSIIIVSLVQAFVWYSAFVNAGSGSALNFISFAGTLVSIILAVLAIGYTYGESISQKNQSDTVVNQISTLNQAISNIKEQTGHLEQVKDISENLAKFGKQMDSKFDQTHKQVESLNSAICQLNMGQSKSEKSNNKDLTPEQAQQLTRSLIDDRQPINEIATLACILTDGLPYTSLLPSGIDRFLALAEDKFEDKDHSSSKDILVGAVFTTYSILCSLGLIKKVESEGQILVEVSPSLREEFVHAVQEKPGEAGEFYSAVREEMLKST